MFNPIQSSPRPFKPWNKGRLIGQKLPLKAKEVWAIRTKLQLDGSVRDLALFNLAIDSKLRACDLVTLRVEDISTNGTSEDRATVRQQKTGRPVRFEITEHTRESVKNGLDTVSSSGRMMMKLIGVLEEWNREMLIERTNAGIARTIANGSKLGRKSVLTSSIKKQITELKENGFSIRKISDEIGINRGAIQRFLSDTKSLPEMV